MEHVLEVGCGTGIITRELTEKTRSSTFGIDYEFNHLTFAHDYDVKTQFLCGDGLHMPFPNDHFSLVCCHFFLLWIHDQPKAISEMFRVTKDDGWIIIFAEPDHAARIDYPDIFLPYGKIQTDSLVRQGIDPIAGRKIGNLLTACELQDVKVGELQWQLDKPDFASALAEWNVATEDMRTFLSSDQIKIYLDYEKKAWEESKRVQIIPTFYAMGKVKK